jgi:hypothetical protein
MPENWIEHRRADGERVGWMVPAGNGFHVVDLLGRRRPADPVEWLAAEEALDALGIGYLADGYTLTMPDGTQRRVRIGEVSETGIVVVADDFGGASAVGAVPPERFALPFPAPATLRPGPPSAEPEPEPAPEPEPPPPPAQRPPGKRRRIGWIITVVLLALALTGAGIIAFLLYQRLDEALTVIEQQNELIDEKETFSASMQDLVDTAAEFDGVLYGDLVPWRDYERLADSAYAQRRDAAGLRERTTQAQAATAELEAKLAAAGDQAAGNASKTVYEKVLDRLGDGFVTTVIDNADKLCDGDVLGCVISDDPYTVHIDKSDVKLPYMTSFLKTGIAYHEFAHVLQFTNPEETELALESFKGDPETMADCFALTYLKGWKLKHTIPIDAYSYYEVDIGYGYTCNSKQRKAIREWHESLGFQSSPISQ